MLTQLRGLELVDDSGRREMLSDFEVSLLEGDYPPVTHLHFTAEGKPKRIEWTTVRAFEHKKGRIKVADLSLGKEIDDDAQNDGILLIRDIRDALIIDLVNRTTTRSTDLQLDESNGQLRLTATDAGIGAMLRRISRGLYKRVNKNALSDWKYVEFLRGDPQVVTSGAGYHLRIARLSAGEIARLADYIPYLHAAELLMLLPDPKAADVLEAMSVERRLQVFEELDEKVAVIMLTLMSPDLAADLAARLHVAEMKKYLAKMPKEQSGRIVELLRYPENSVGGVMINDMIFFPADLNVVEARKRLQKSLKDLDFISVVFLVENDKSRKLLGVVALREILTADAELKLEDLMDPYILTLNPYDDAAHAARRIINNQLPAMPVTGTEGDLLGAMTVDAALSQLVSATSSLQTLRIFS
ncbi:MAG: CBS domain-containing protein [Pyrinomonadaceae bacterium]